MRKAVLILFSLIFLLASNSCSSNKSFKETKQETKEFVLNNVDVLSEKVVDILSKKSADGITYDNGKTIDYKEYDYSNYVVFGYDAQGMLGGQYWGFYYSTNDVPIGDQGYELDLTKSKDGWYWQEPDGNNYYYTEKITDNWFFSYTDYDHS